MKDQENPLKEFLSEAEVLQNNARDYLLTFDLINSLFNNESDKPHVYNIQGIVPIPAPSSSGNWISIVMRVHKKPDEDLTITLGIEKGPNNFERLRHSFFELIHPSRVTVEKIEEITKNEILLAVKDKLQRYSEVRESFKEVIYTPPDSE